MRVLIVSPRAQGIGGIAYHVSTLARKLRERGFNVTIYSCENTLHVPIKGLANPSFAFSSWLKCLLDLPYPPQPYDVVHAHNIPSALAMRSSWAKKKILTLHGVYSEQLEVLHRWFPRAVAKRAERVALSWADELTVVSMDAAKHYRKKGFHVHYIPNAIDFSELPSQGLKLYDNQVIYVGRLSKEKGVDLLLKAFKETPQYHLLIVGGGPKEAELRRASRRLSNIHVIGPKPRKLALKLIKGSDLLVQPSRREGLSTAVLEAMAMGVPVVATNVGGNAELIKHQTTGLLIEPDNVTSIIKAVEMLITDSSLAKKLATQAKSHVAAHYSWDKVLRQYIRLYKEAAD